MSLGLATRGYYGVKRTAAGPEIQIDGPVGVDSEETIPDPIDASCLGLTPRPLDSELQDDVPDPMDAESQDMIPTPMDARTLVPQPVSSERES